MFKEDQFILDTSREALDVDSSMYTHPVSVKVHNPAEINEIVDKITYHKVRFRTIFKYPCAIVRDLTTVAC